MKLFLVQIAVASFLGLTTVTALECYSCDSDRTDLSCNDIQTLPKVNCLTASDSSAIGLVCGYQHFEYGNSTTERIYRGCMVAGECDLLGRQNQLTTRLRMLSCQECSTNGCNEMKSGQNRIGGVGLSFIVAVVAYVCQKM